MLKSKQQANENVRGNDKIMEINVSSGSKARVLARVEDLISDNVSVSGNNHKFYIVTPNPELVLKAQKDEKLKTALNAADFSIPDGIGVSQAAKYLSLTLPNEKILRFVIGFLQGLRVGAATFFDREWLTREVKTIKGRVFFMDLIKLADKNNWKVFLLGGLGQEALAASQKLEIRYKKLKVEADGGPKLDKSAQPITEVDKKIEKDVIDKINKFNPDFLFVAFGNPKQEIWIHDNLSKLNIRGAMAVGGSLRYAAGLSSLPPVWMEKIGLEWLWRLVTEPFRLPRIWNAVVVFPWKVFLYKISGGMG